MRIDAPGGLRQTGPGRFLVEGGVTVVQGHRLIRNDGRAEVDRDDDSMRMEGEVLLREPGMLLQGPGLLAENMSAPDSVLLFGGLSEQTDHRREQQDVRYVLHNEGFHGSARSVRYEADSGRIMIDNGRLSRCEPARREFWRLQARAIVLDHGAGRGYARGPSLRLGGIPLLYYPGTVPFPLGDERASGFLSPSIGRTRHGGADVTLPYYFNLAPHYDLTLSPRFLAERGILTQAEFRHLGRRSYDAVNLAFLDNDLLHDTESLQELAEQGEPVPRFPAAKRWSLNYRHNGSMGRNWRSDIQYSAVSDPDYFRDLSGNGIRISGRTHLNRRARLRWNGDDMRFAAVLRRVEVIQPDALVSPLAKPFDRMPRFFFSAGTDDLPGGFAASFSSQYNAFRRDFGDLSHRSDYSSLLQRGILFTGQRFNFDPVITWAAPRNPGWFLRLRAGYRYIAYRLEDQAQDADATPELGVGVFNLDGGLIFERERRGGGTQTLEPRIFYLYNEYEDQSGLPVFDTGEVNFNFSQLFRRDRFAGGDRVGDANQLSFALTSRIYNRRGRERARFNLGQVFYFADRRVNLSNPLWSRPPRYLEETSKSALSLSFSMRAGDHWRLNGWMQWDEVGRQVQEGGFRVRFQLDRNRLFNVTHRRRFPIYQGFDFVLPQDGIDPRIRQSEASLVWALSPRWKALARWNYDHSNRRRLESFAGIEYSNCCATIRLVGREWLDRNDLYEDGVEDRSGVFLQFILHGIGDITGGRLGTLLQEEILGFNPDTW